MELEDARESLRALGYSVTTVLNPTASELQASLIAHRSRPDWGRHASSVVALMGHGRGASLQCYDGMILPFDRLFGELSLRRAPALEGKPKIWLVQACRTDEHAAVAADADADADVAHTATVDDDDDAAAAAAAAAVRNAMAVAIVAVDAEEAGEYGAASLGSCDNDGEPSDEEAQSEVMRTGLSNQHDFLWGFATVRGSVAYRGAMFSALRAVVSEVGFDASWLELLHRTNERLREMSATRPDQPLPSMEISSTCRGPPFGPADLALPADGGAATDGCGEAGEADAVGRGASQVCQVASAGRARVAGRAHVTT